MMVVGLVVGVLIMCLVWVLCCWCCRLWVRICVLSMFSVYVFGCFCVRIWMVVGVSFVFCMLICSSVVLVLVLCFRLCGYLWYWC